MCYCCISMKDCKKAAIAPEKANAAIKIKSGGKQKNHCEKHPEIIRCIQRGQKAESMDICVFWGRINRTLRRRRGIEKTNTGSAHAQGVPGMNETVEQAEIGIEEHGNIFPAEQDSQVFDDSIQKQQLDRQHERFPPRKYRSIVLDGLARTLLRCYYITKDELLLG